nr:immunoglobulin heavy chain junction region [Macaca mulatta]MOX38333.1 immunoglobulin heavy chain junction region [Macaca mulatta]MOX39505.1 immunoglobulin heavy chain junction region [Macaca mulatta]MOX40379.1 immunoglobulin heavy chain junction region [Macaca mulatta]MOX40817.1 immunoglobulin heavy chain junction region [Macaca mulatta]
CANGRVGIDFW